MIDIYLSSGHGNKPGRDQGAVVGTTTEGALAVQIRQVLAASIIKYGGRVTLDDPSLITAETVAAWRKKIKSGDIAIDLHFNASANNTVDGVECIVPASPQSLELTIADYISDVISAEASTPERGRVGKFDGVKLETETARKRLAWMTLPGATILVECQFMTDPIAIAGFLRAWPRIADKIGLYLATYQKTH